MRLPDRGEKVDGKGAIGTSVGWVWLFPISHFAHIAEEVFAAEGFPAWAMWQMGFDLSVPEFIALNAAGFAVVLVCTALMAQRRSLLWLGVVMGTVFGANGILHLVTSVVTRSYSPGVVTGTILWIPLAALALSVGWRSVRRRVFVATVAAGLAIQGLLVLALATPL